MLKRIVAVLLALALMVPAAGLAKTTGLSANGSMVRGSQGDAVKEAQELLKLYGYYSGPIDGKYGSGMVNAVRKFQARNGLKVDGAIGEKTLKVLKSDKVIEASGETQGVSDNGSLVVGTTGGEVMELQNLLTTYGYFTGAVDGNFGSDTEAAVKKFQSRNGLTADGKVGAKTWNVLYDTENVVRATDKIKPIYTLATGSSGSQVEELQLMLRKSLFYAGKIDGVYGANVARAVREFQAAVGLPVDGKAGASTQKTLQKFAEAIGDIDGVDVDHPANVGLAYPKRTLRAGNRGYDVLILQMKLASKNYLSGRYTRGYYDTATANAVKKVEKANKLTEDGIFGTLVRRHLWPTGMASLDDRDAYEKSTEYDAYLGNTLKIGSKGEEVSYAQMKLKSAGYLLDAGDGKFGESTAAAVMKLQKDYGLKVDGIVGTETWIVIRYLLTAEDAEPEEVDAKKSYVGAINTKLRRGSRGIQVQKLQQMLIQAGFLASGEDDGKYGPKTAAAVIAFQRYMGIKEDGVVGTQTLARLQLVLDGEDDTAANLGTDSES